MKDLENLREQKSELVAAKEVSFSIFFFFSFNILFTGTTDLSKWTIAIVRSRTTTTTTTASLGKKWRHIPLIVFLVKMLLFGMDSDQTYLFFASVELSTESSLRYKDL